MSEPETEDVCVAILRRALARDLDDVERAIETGNQLAAHRAAARVGAFAADLSDVVELDVATLDRVQALRARVMAMTRESREAPTGVWDLGAWDRGAWR